MAMLSFNERSMWLLLAVLPLGGLAADPGPDLEPLLAQARRVQQADLTAWGELTFRRQVTRERLKAEGEVAERQELDFRVTPKGDGFDEELRFIEGRFPTRDEVREHRREARFTKRYKAALSGEDPRYGHGDFSMSHLLRRSSYVYRGVESVAGHRCHRLEFAADPEPPGGGVAARLTAATAGSLWLAVDGLHIVRSETHLERPIAAVGRLVKLRKLAIRLEGGAAGELWLPLRIVVESELSVAGKKIRKRNTFRYSQFEAASP